MTNYEIPTAQASGFLAFIQLIGEYVKNPVKMVRLTNSVVDLHNEYVRIAVSDLEEVIAEKDDRIVRLTNEVSDLRAQVDLARAGNRADLAADTRRGIDFAVSSTQVMRYLEKTQKIYAIKHVRQATGIGLLAAKNAVESREVQEALANDCWCQDCTGIE